MNIIQKDCEDAHGNLIRIDKKVYGVDGQFCLWVGRYLQLTSCICDNFGERPLVSITIAGNVGHCNECGDSKVVLAFFAT